jgi:Ca2+-binding RTX toxin-like protein
MKEKNPTRKSTSTAAPETSAEQCTRYARDVAALGDPVDLGAFLDARNASLALNSTLAGVSRAYSQSLGWLPHYAYRLTQQSDAAAVATAAGDSASSVFLGTAGGTDPVSAPAAPIDSVNPASTDVATSAATSVTSLPSTSPAVPVEVEDAVGGGPSIATSLEAVYSDPSALTVEGTQTATLDAQRRPGLREDLVGSPRADRIVGGPGKNEIDGREGNDEIVGGASDDVFIGGTGDDVLDGGLGNDIARYGGSVLEYDITRISSTQARVRHARPRPGQNEGNDLVRNVKRLDFKDRQVYLDGRNNAPIAQADEGLSTVDGRSLTIPFSRLVGNDVDLDGDRLTITEVKGKPANSVRIVGNSVVFTPPGGIQWALADFTSYETTFLYTVSDGKGGTATASASVTINRPRDLRGLRTGPADVSRDGAGGPGDPPGQVFTKASGQSVTGTDGGDLILVPSSAVMTGGTVDGGAGVDELRFTNTGTAQTLTLGTSLTNVEQVVIGTGSTSIADTSGTTGNSVNASSVTYGLLMTGNAGANTLTGTAFGDQIDGGSGADRMTGGNGDDTTSSITLPI